MLVYFHNHSDSGLPVVIAPEHNVLNRWHFHGAGIPFRGLSWADSLVKLAGRGLLHAAQAADVRRRRVAQVGPGAARVHEDRRPDPVHRAGPRAAGGKRSLVLATAASPITREQLALLEPLQVYAEPAAAGAHTTGVH